ncbi:MAG TPA: acyl-CoA dehydrogenase family protein [Xanthobacteraceae bacterium]|jgi:putative acyl-CoA dehydrogenase|nr:acyl-CoA dehydrogenase family protein [Xanthobacteraceae bacterium]
MSALRPRSRLETHDVSNQPPPFEDVNLFTSDAALQDAVAAAGGEAHMARLSAFGAQAGSAETAAWAMQANENPPRLKAFDRYGRRIDEVEFHPAYHRLMALGIEAGVASAAWSGIAAGHVLHAGLEFLMAQAEPGVCCPMTMTSAAPAALRFQPDLAAKWTPKIVASRYDPSSQPMHGKSGVTIGMAMTEKQGGSDVRANTTRAVPRSDGGYALTGHKWFCSAPMSDAFLTLAYTDKGLTCFLAPRWTPDGERNAIHLMRLKDKLGDRANASAEIEYHDAYAEMVGEEGRGVRTIIEMVHYTRFDCILAPAAYMRQAVANALWHAAHRTAFQRKLIDQPLMRSLLADMALESEAATALAFCIARSLDGSADERAAAFARIATPIGKYWVNKRVVNLSYEAMEVHGGGGYIEDGVMTRIYRQSPINSIWEGSGNVVCLDILRAIERDPHSAQALIAELENSRGANRLLDRAIDDAKAMVAGPHDEALARRLAETTALALQGTILVRKAPSFVSDAFCATRLCDHPGLSCGAIDAKIDVDALINRAMPH